MVKNKMSRRTFLMRTAQLPVIGTTVIVLHACSKADKLVCADPESLGNAAEISLRRSLNYTDESPIPSETCSGCAFFKPADEKGACGACDLFNGGLTSPVGRCDSWSKKA